MENYRCGSKASDFLLSFSGLDVYYAYPDSLYRIQKLKFQVYILEKLNNSLKIKVANSNRWKL